ncbi:hypothetical protein [Paenibacillus sp. FSL R7-0331]|uniref:hypothetical protein n=1 Tax=Paenibacillus sp. FSL R7-0331 TaxID=1536773 RepID=UPI0004F699FB|nr:hypothetical protein [Paenibacillus sp. FSL R7-0331]AIQ52932.1 hypothetical protein R70331_16310 [Paenibacillus sp. FSL R7-0331]
MSGKMSLNKLTKHLLLEYCIYFSQGSGIQKSYCYKYIKNDSDTNRDKYTDKDAQTVAKAQLMKEIFRLGQGGKGGTGRKQDPELEEKINHFVQHNSKDALRSILNVELRFDRRRDYLFQILDSCNEYNRDLSQINWGLVHKELAIQQEIIKKGLEEKEERYYMVYMLELAKRPYPDHLVEQLIGFHATILLSILFVDSCDPLLMDWLLDDPDEQNDYSVLLRKKNFSEESIDSLKEEYRHGIPADKYADLYFRYVQKNYMKIHICTSYLLDKFGSNKLDLWVSDTSAIKKTATVMFGLEQPKFELL